MRTELIWKLFSGEVYRFILSRCKDEDLANDLLQEVFLRVHLKKEQLKEEILLKTWLFTIARNTVIDHFRSESRLTAGNGPEIPVPVEVEQHSPEDCLRPLIKKLPAKYREALLLSDIQGHMQAEVARKLNISLSGAKSRIQRARILLQEGYVQCCNYKIKDGMLVGENKSQQECKVCD